MKEDKEIIQALLGIIDAYDNNDIAKNMPINCYQENDTTIIIFLSTKGDANKGTPFYFGNVYTCIIKEYWAENKIVYADLLYHVKE